MSQQGKLSQAKGHNLLPCLLSFLEKCYKNGGDTKGLEERHNVKVHLISAHTFPIPICVTVLQQRGKKNGANDM